MLISIIVFSVTIKSRILVTALKKGEKSQDDLKLLKKSMVKVTDKSAMIEKTVDDLVLTPPRMENESFLHYLKTTKEWG